MLVLRAMALALVLILLAGLAVWRLGGLPMLGPGPEAQKPEPTALSDELLTRFDKAKAAAKSAGIDMVIRSGWRSADQQRRLYDDAVAEHGEKEARRTVLPPERSAHVAGTAVDVSPKAAAKWLEARSEQFGLCRTYANEWWHFEVTGAVGEPCPAMKPDASVDW